MPKAKMTYKGPNPKCDYKGIHWEHGQTNEVFVTEVELGWMMRQGFVAEIDKPVKAETPAPPPVETTTTTDEDTQVLRPKRRPYRRKG